MAGEVKKALGMLGFSGGNGKDVEAYAFFPVSCPTTSPPSFKTQGRIDRPDRPLYQQVDLAREEYERSKNGQKTTSYSSLLSNLPSTLSLGKKDTQILTNSGRTLLCLLRGCLLPEWGIHYEGKLSKL